jgi:hypothetical protein
MAVPLASCLPGDSEHKPDLGPAPSVLASSSDSVVDFALLDGQLPQGQAYPAQVRRILRRRRRRIERVQPSSSLGSGLFQFLPSTWHLHQLPSQVPVEL